MKHLGALGRWPVVREDDYRVAFISTEILARTRQSKTTIKGSQSHVKPKKSGPTSKSRAGTGDAAAATGTTGPSVVTQIPAIQGITKRHG
jgi:hypothetical protein